MASQPPSSTAQHGTLAGGSACAITATGPFRATNEDRFLLAPELGLLAVADGMGGHADGALASAMALDVLRGFLDTAGHGADDTFAPGAHGGAPLHTLAAAVAQANAHLYQANVARGRADGTGMGTTLTVLWRPVLDGPAYVGHVGDSRLYLLRAGRLAQLTRDQTLYQQALDAGRTTALPGRNLLLQALGPGPAVQPELLVQPVLPGDLYLLCSDGLHGETAPADLAAILATARDDNLHDCCAALVAQALADGSRDNVTAVLLRCSG
ncbi:PP2C family protein-serine/threonine phosphatase [Pseudoduganella chitinolytica]|uniref:Protein phosphatase 2C domain-containing protein n=1 Tax=Pseudoduganella chitinolytica TaxID=34070 RepID=A0ABY8BFR4_9BURK|nr:protein phosphatase 2C domain-containing protein [Pseudoduganella chitinolytica]WEF34745.1 protein phosphatase 2C domain-containing protein [Pseudoduganella chitinolytica]